MCVGLGWRCFFTLLLLLAWLLPVRVEQSGVRVVGHVASPRCACFYLKHAPADECRQCARVYYCYKRKTPRGGRALGACPLDGALGLGCWALCRKCPCR